MEIFVGEEDVFGDASNFLDAPLCVLSSATDILTSINSFNATV